VNAGGNMDHQDASTYDKFTALHFASQKNFGDIVDFLLSVGANPSILDAVGQSPLACAVQNGHVDVMKKLLLAGADKSWSLENNDLLHVAVTAGQDKALDLLLDEGLFKERNNSDNLTPIRLASVMGHVTMVRRLHMKTIKVAWQQAQDVNASCGGSHAELFLYTLCVDDGRGGEMSTVYQGHQLATYLKGQFEYLDYRYKLTTTSKAGAVNDVTDKMTVEVSEKPAEIENPGGVSALHIASGSGHADVAEYLLSAGAQVNSRDSKKRTPLIFAAASAQLRTMDMLITASPTPADLEACAYDGSTALHFAAFRGAPMCLGRLASAGANKEALTIKRESPLHFAAKGGHREVWYRMFDLGAKRDAKDVVGMTAMEVATEDVDDLDLVLCTGEVKVVGNGLGVYKLMPHPNLFLKPFSGNEEEVEAATVIQRKQRGQQTTAPKLDTGIPVEHQIATEL
jgi:ankyrin